MISRPSADDCGLVQVRVDQAFHLAPGCFQLPLDALAFALTGGVGRGGIAATPLEAPAAGPAKQPLVSCGTDA